MPESRLRGRVGSIAANPCARSSVAEAAGDSMACTICPHKEIFQNSNKHKTARSVRYDLENALVGLCDVWFGEIKPYLVRNKIKLHVNCSSAGGDHQRSGAAGASPSFDPGAAGASPSFDPGAAGASPSFDPGAAPDNTPRTARYAGSSAPPVARTPRHNPTTDRTPSRRPLSPLLSVSQRPHDGTPVQSHNNEKKKVGQLRNRRRHRRRAQPEPSWRVPRLCRTYTVLCQTGAGGGAGSRAVKTTSHLPPKPQPPHDDFYRFIVPRRDSVMKNKNTQTEQAPSVSRGCQPVRPRLCKPSPRRTASARPRFCNPSPRAAESGLNRTASSNGSASPLPSPILPPRIICRPKRPQALAAELPSSLQYELYNMAGGNEKGVKLLYSSSEKNDRDHPSFMDLIVSSRQDKPDHKKLPPWR